MGNVSILDCTLRDGGYINNWEFGESNIKYILRKLDDANTDIIECGFLRDKPYDSNISVFNSTDQIKEILPRKNSNLMYVAMIALGDIDPNSLSCCDGKSIDGIRLTFHGHEWEEAKEAIKVLMDKNYKVFVQPVGTVSYSDKDLLDLIDEVNKLKPYAFYLVDTFGSMGKKELKHMFFITDNNLEPEISIGFHSHNNLQMSFYNAQSLLDISINRHIIIDSSVYGMGRAAGNLCTELIAGQINNSFGERYNMIPLLDIIDNCLLEIKNRASWGYAIPYYLSAAEGCHPNFAEYLIEKQTLSMSAIYSIIRRIPQEKRALYDYQLVHDLYLSYQAEQVDDQSVIKALNNSLQNRNILILCPGNNINLYKSNVTSWINKYQPTVISVNFIPRNFKNDIVFISNDKRLDKIGEVLLEDTHTIIATSNLVRKLNPQVEFVNYSDYIGEGREFDNSALMLLRVLKKAGIKKVAIAGFDGFDILNHSQNYYDNEISDNLSKHECEGKNQAIYSQLSQLRFDLEIQFITPSKFEK